MILNQQLSINMLPLKDMDLKPGEYHTRLTREQINPEVFEMLADHRLRIIHAEIFILAPFQMSKNAHVDGSNIVIDEPWQSRCKLNWTLSKAEETNCWYRVTDLDALRARRVADQRSNVNTPFLYVPFSLTEKIFSCTPMHWNLFDAGTPHAGFNNCGEWRWNISFTLTDLHSTETGSKAWMSLDEVRERMIQYV